jgi:hypothetical protein
MADACAGAQRDCIIAVAIPRFLGYHWHVKQAPASGGDFYGTRQENSLD